MLSLVRIEIKPKSEIAIKLLTILAALLLNHTASAQGERKFIREGNREYNKDKYPESEILYRKAADKNNSYADAIFNLGNALYRQQKFEDAGRQYITNSGMNEDKMKKAAAFYNLGNSYLMADKIKESIEAYKESLRLYPKNPEAKYNLAYAQDLLKQQEQQQQNNDNSKQDKDQNQDQNKEKSEDNKKENEQQQQQEQQEQQEKQEVISREDAERLLNAIENDERNVQEKVKKAKTAKSKIRTLKNW